LDGIRASRTLGLVQALSLEYVELSDRAAPRLRISGEVSDAP
jgi:hypothetical protein